MKKKIVSIAWICSCICLAACGKKEPAFTTGASVKIETTLTTEATTTAQPATSTQAPVVIGFGKPTASTEAAPSRGGLEAEDLIFVYGELTLEVGEAFDEKKDRIDLPCTEAKGQACIGGGFDISYYFGEDPTAPVLSVLTLGDSGKQVIYDIYVEGKGMSTPKGAVIGTTTREEVAKLYGTPSSVHGATDQFTLDKKVILAFTFEKGVLASFDYLDTTAGA